MVTSAGIPDTDYNVKGQKYTDGGVKKSLSYDTFFDIPELLPQAMACDLRDLCLDRVSALITGKI